MATTVKVRTVLIIDIPSLRLIRVGNLAVEERDERGKALILREALPQPLHDVPRLMQSGERLVSRALPREDGGQTPDGHRHIALQPGIVGRRGRNAGIGLVGKRRIGQRGRNVFEGVLRVGDLTVNLG
jgi:hypothetical protein